VTDRKDMLAALRTYVLPELRARGFKGSLPHLRRASSETIDLITVQFDKWGGGFIIEIARCEPTGVTTHWGEQIEPARVTAHDVHPLSRHRVGSPRRGEDGHWFRYDSGQQVGVVAQSVLSYLAEVEAWFASPAPNS
jgi:hypothetical protein